MYKIDFLGEIERFADLDSEMVTAQDKEDLLVEFNQQGQSVKLRIAADGGRVIEDRNGSILRHGSYRALLASGNFGNLRRLVDASIAFLQREASYIFDTTNHLPIVGRIGSRTRFDGTDLLADADDWLLSPIQPGAPRSLVIDGPAGIGKTHLIRRLVASRALAFGPASRPPILHVQSKGKKLSTLDDVVAGTLNGLRLSLTNEQVPILIRNGLLQIAIDGFDELADPAGYETAWGSVVDLVNDIYGFGGIILAGRDTFLDADRVKEFVPNLNNPSTEAIHLRTLKKAEASAWLEAETSAQVVQELNGAGLLEEGSYALRPLFIKELARLGDKNFDSEQLLTFPLRSLVTSILSREAKLLKIALRATNELQSYELLLSFFKEVSRFMADMESDSIELSAIDLVAEISFTDKVSSDEVAMMRHRAAAFSLLEQDGATSKRRFPHSEIQDYFLSLSYLDLVSDGNIPKSIRRNIIGTDFLDTFHDIAAWYKDVMPGWRNRVRDILRKERYVDRTIQNLAAMAVASADTLDQEDQRFLVENCSFDELCLRGTCGDLELSYVQVAHLDVRGADISSVTMNQCSIGTLLADQTTILPAQMPLGWHLYLDERGSPRGVFDTRQIEEWCEQHTRSLPKEALESDHILFLEKICRIVIRQHWIREVEGDRAGKLLQDPKWVETKEALESRNLLSIREGVAVGGPRSRFFRIEKAGLILERDESDSDVRNVRRILSNIRAD